jgi:hypothetical protein
VVVIGRAQHVLQAMRNVGMHFVYAAADQSLCSARKVLLCLPHIYTADGVLHHGHGSGNIASRVGDFTNRDSELYI